MYLLDMVGLNHYPKVEYSRSRIFKDTISILDFFKTFLTGIFCQPNQKKEAK